MSFGYSVGDFVALGQLAWKIYKACKSAPKDFKNLSQEVLSLHALLKEVEETYSDATLLAAQQSRLGIVGDGCRSVLEDLQSILDKYNSLGTKTKRTWDRLGWASKDVSELRLRLVSNTVLLTTLISSSQVVQKRLDLFLQELRDGKHQGSIVSAQMVDSLSKDEKQAQRTKREELEETGTCVATFDANKDFIMNWFETAISTVPFEQQTAEDGSDSIFNENDLSQSLEDPGHEMLSQPLEDQRQDTNWTSSVGLQALRLSQEAKIQRRRRPRVAGLNQWLLLHRLFTAIKHEAINENDRDGYTALHRAADSGHETVVRVLLRDGAEINRKDRHGSTALHWAAASGHATVVQLLLENGAQIHEKGWGERTALHWVAASGHATVVQLLLDRGAKINEKDRYGYTALGKAIRHNRLQVATILRNAGGFE